MASKASAAIPTQSCPWPTAEGQRGRARCQNVTMIFWSRELPADSPANVHTQQYFGGGQFQWLNVALN